MWWPLLAIYYTEHSTLLRNRLSGPCRLHSLSSGIPSPHHSSSLRPQWDRHIDCFFCSSCNDVRRMHTSWLGWGRNNNCLEYTCDTEVVWVGVLWWLTIMTVAASCTLMGCTQMELEVGTEIKAFASPEIASITFVAGSATLEPVALHCVELLSRLRYDYASISG